MKRKLGVLLYATVSDNFLMKYAYLSNNYIERDTFNEHDW